MKPLDLPPNVRYIIEKVFKALSTAPSMARAPGVITFTAFIMSVSEFRDGESTYFSAGSESCCTT